MIAAEGWTVLEMMQNETVYMTQNEKERRLTI